jgi:hypothetical protein
MVTGVTSLYISWRSASEEAATRLDAYPTASQNDITPLGLGVRVELVNQSLRPIVVRSAALLLDGEVVSEASGWIDDVRLVEEAASDPARLRAAGLTFPIGLAAREGKSVALMMDVWTPFVDAASAADESAARNRFRQLASTLASLHTGEGSDRLELRVEHVPGGSSTYPISAVVAASSSVATIESAAALLRRIPPQFWVVDLLERDNALAGLTLRRRFAGTDEVDLVRLDVWNVRSAFHRSVVRPVVARQQTLFPVDRLPRGDYVATFRVGGQVVAYRSFAVPIR